MAISEARIELPAMTARGRTAAAVTFDVTGSYALGLWVTALTAVGAPALLWVAAPRRPDPPPRLER